MLNVQTAFYAYHLPALLQFSLIRKIVILSSLFLGHKIKCPLIPMFLFGNAHIWRLVRAHIILMVVHHIHTFVNTRKKCALWRVFKQLVKTKTHWTEMYDHRRNSCFVQQNIPQKFLPPSYTPRVILILFHKMVVKDTATHKNISTSYVISPFCL